MADFIAGPITDPLPQRLTPCSTTLIDAATININAAVADVFLVQIAGNRNIAAPTNSKGGQILTLAVSQNLAGGNTLSFDPVFVGVSDADINKGSLAVTILTFLCVGNGGTFQYVLTASSSSAGGLVNVGTLTLLSGTNNITANVSSTITNKPVLVSLQSSVGAIAASAAVLKASVTAGVVTVTLVNAATGAAINASSDLKVSVLVDAR